MTAEYWLKGMAFYDVIVIGGGIVGVSIAREFSRGHRVCLIEKNHSLMQEASGNNSSLLHCGFDTDPEKAPLENLLVRRGFEMMKNFVKNIPQALGKGGALVVAWNDEEVNRLQVIKEKAESNGVRDTQLLSPEEVKTRCPQLTECKGALYVPQEYPANAAKIGQRLVDECQCRFVLNEPVVRIERIRKDCWRINNHYVAPIVVNAAGLSYDDIEQLRGGNAVPSSCPRVGQFLVLPNSNIQLSSIIYPVPSERTKGIVMWSNVDNSLVVGPTAEDRSGNQCSSSSRHLLQNVMHRFIEVDVNESGAFEYCGVRPATTQRDYVIRYDEGWVTVGGVRSTGFSACLAIAHFVCNLIPKPKISHAQFPKL